MVQTGDPTNTGKAGECIWGGKFTDEIKESPTILHFVQCCGLFNFHTAPDPEKCQLFTSYTQKMVMLFNILLT